MPVSTIFENIEAGMSVSEIIEAFDWTDRVIGKDAVLRVPEREPVGETLSSDLPVLHLGAISPFTVATSTTMPAEPGVLDTGVLVYATNVDAPRHAACCDLPAIPKELFKMLSALLSLLRKVQEVSAHICIRTPGEPRSLHG